MLAFVGLVLFLIAAILDLVGKHHDWLLWLIIIGGILYGLDMVFSFGTWAPWYRGRNRPSV